MTALYTTLLESESKESLAAMVCELREQRADLLTTAKNAAASISAIYQWLERVEKAGGATSLEGVSACHAMIKSMRRNADRIETLVTVPLLSAISRAEAANEGDGQCP